jgi:beta-aspartyl-peptidase (threonine type)
MRYKKLPVKIAAKAVLNEVKKNGGRGGCIALDRKGNVTMRFTTSGMFRAKIDGKGKRKVSIYAK